MTPAQQVFFELPRGKFLLPRGETSAISLNTFKELELARRAVRDRLGDMDARVASCLEQACPCPCHHAGEV